MSQVIQSTNRTSQSAAGVPNGLSVYKYKDIFLKFIYDSDKLFETKGKYSFYIFFPDTFPGGTIEFKNLSTGEIQTIHGYNNPSGIIHADLDDIEFTFTYEINGSSQTIKKIFYFKNALNFNNQLFRKDLITDKLHDIIFEGYLKIAHNLNIPNFDAHLYYEDDKTHSINLGCHTFQDFDFKEYDYSIDYAKNQMTYDSKILALLTYKNCELKLWNYIGKCTILNLPKIYYELFFFFKKLKTKIEKTYNKTYDENNPFRLHYINPIIEVNSLIIDFY